MNILLFGCGKMGGAMARAWLLAHADHAPLINDMVIIKPSPVTDPALLDARCRWFPDLAQAQSAGVGAPDVIILGIKPQQMPDLVPTCRPIIGPETFVVSLAAGKTLGQLCDWVGHDRVVRTMPNTPAEIAQGVTAAIPASGVTPAARAQISALLSAVGMVCWVDDEALIDVITALSGSGPAYVFLMIEAMAAAAVRLGLSAEMALDLARATVQGAGNLAMMRAPDHPAQLRQAVTSPGGTTAAALEVLMAPNAMPDLLYQAMTAAIARARALAAA